MKKKILLVNVIVAWMHWELLFCVTVDHQTKEDNTVTIRYRDTMQQERIPMDKIKQIVEEAIS